MKEPIDTHALPETQSKMLVGALQIAANVLAQQMADPAITPEQIEKAASLLKANKALQITLSAPILAREKAAAEKAEAQAKKGPLAHPPVNRAQKRRGR